ncbi:MAG: DegV family protein [[Clostridium] innocuum]
MYELTQTAYAKDEYAFGKCDRKHIAFHWEQGYDEIVSVPLSSGLSSTFNTIQIMAREIGIPVIHIEDYTTCDLQGHEALLAKKYADEENGEEMSCYTA